MTPISLATIFCWALCCGRVEQNWWSNVAKGQVLVVKRVNVLGINKINVKTRVTKTISVYTVLQTRLLMFLDGYKLHIESLNLNTSGFQSKKSWGMFLLHPMGSAAAAGWLWVCNERWWWCDDAMLSDDDGVTSVMWRQCCGHWPLVSSVYSVPQYLESGVCTGASPGHYTAIGKGKAKVTFRYVTLVTLLGTWSWSLSITVTLLSSLNKFYTKIFIIYNI